jgi:hypothetical protein
LLAFIYLDNADKKKYGSLLNNLSQQQSLKNDQYPKTINDAKQVLDNHRHDNAKEKNEAARKQSEKDKGPGKGPGNDQNSNMSPLELSFAQMLNGACHCCGKQGHWAPKCPKKNSIPKEQWAINLAKKKDAAFHQFEQSSKEDGAGTVSSNQGPPSVVSAPERSTGWAGVQLQRIKGVQLFITGDVDMKQVILLDNETTSSIFANEDYVHDITNAKQQLDLETNGGTLTTNKEATVPGFWKKVWFDKDAITNIFAFHEMVQQYPVTYDSKKEDAFIVHISDVKKIKFIKAPNGLYYYIPPASFI